MILPIYPYGAPVLREQTKEVAANSEALQRLIDDLFETMRGASGIGLAAPQVGRRERIFVVDLSPLLEKEQEPHVHPEDYQPMVFINPEILEESEEEVEYEEGCLSIPDLREPVVRPERIRLRYLDRDFVPQEREVDAFLARVIQHEYDHLEGILFIDRISALRRKLLQRRLREIANGEVEADYPMALRTPRPA
jgi:peptide deformylase